MRSALGVVLVLAIGALAGCGRSANETFSNVKQAAPAADGMAAGEARARAGNGAPDAAPVPRKIIYNGTLELLVDDIDQADKDIRELIGKEKGAYISRAEIRGTPGTRRSGSLTVRVPVEQFDSFRQAVSKLGEVQRESLDSQDVTDQFYDLDARIKNNLAEEESLRKLLDKASVGKLDDYLAVRDKLRQVTAELDVQKGQLQRLDKLSALATITITLNERKSYVRPESPAFGTQIGRTFGNSLEALKDFGQGLVLVLVALVPWLPLIALILLPPWITYRRWRKRSGPVVLSVEPADPPAASV